MRIRIREVNYNQNCCMTMQDKIIDSVKDLKEILKLHKRFKEKNSVVVEVQRIIENKIIDHRCEDGYRIEYSWVWEQLE